MVWPVVAVFATAAAAAVAAAFVIQKDVTERRCDWGMAKEGELYLWLLLLLLFVTNNFVLHKFFNRLLLAISRNAFVIFSSSWETAQNVFSVYTLMHTHISKCFRKNWMKERKYVLDILDGRHTHRGNIWGVHKFHLRVWTNELIWNGVVRVDDERR